MQADPCCLQGQLFGVSRVSLCLAVCPEDFSPLQAPGQRWAIGGARAASGLSCPGDSQLHPGQGSVHRAVGQEAAQPGTSTSIVNR